MSAKEAKPTPEKNLTTFTFPELGVAVEAKTIEEATELAKKKATETKETK